MQSAASPRKEPKPWDPGEEGKELGLQGGRQSQTIERGGRGEGASYSQDHGGGSSGEDGGGAAACI